MYLIILYFSIFFYRIQNKITGSNSEWMRNKVRGEKMKITIHVYVYTSTYTEICTIHIRPIVSS